MVNAPFHVRVLLQGGNGEITKMDATINTTRDGVRVALKDLHVILTVHLQSLNSDWRKKQARKRVKQIYWRECFSACLPAHLDIRRRPGPRQRGDAHTALPCASGRGGGETAGRGCSV